MNAIKESYMVGVGSPVLIAKKNKKRKTIFIRNEYGTLDVFLGEVDYNCPIRYTLGAGRVVNIDNWIGDIYAVKRFGTTPVHVMTVL